MSEAPPSGDRLDSWKAIAEYLQRDVATVRRWEKALGLPIHRVAGTGRSVFAYTSEIDDWLNRAKPLLPVVEPLLPILETAQAAAAPMPLIRALPWRWLVPAAVLAVVAGVLARPRPITVDDLRVELTSAGVIARDSDGAEQWRYQFPATSKTFLPSAPVDHVQVIGGTDPGVYFATSHRGQVTNDRVESGALTFLDASGRPRQRFSFDDAVTFHGTSYGPPWALTAFAVNESGGPRRVALAAHHAVWDPSLVTVLDDRWQRGATFVHAGWIEAVSWVGRERLAVAGFSNAYDGGMIALLDATALDGQGPEPAGSRYFCESCGPNRPLRMFVFPRTELNRVTASPFNRALIQTSADGRLIARTIEMSSPGGDADVLYEFSNPSLDLVSARFSSRYWEMHRALEAEGRITHTREQCPDRDGPRQIRMWEPATGWRNLSTR